MRKKNIYIMYAIAFLQGMVFYGSVATLYRQANGVSMMEISVIESISFVLCLVMELPFGVIADRIGYKRTFVLCCFLYFLSKIVFWRAENFWEFLAERILLSVVMAGLSGVDTSILYLSCEEGESHHVFGVYDSLGQAGLLLASLLFVLLIKEGYRLAAFLTILSYGAAMCLSLFLSEVKKEKEDREKEKKSRLSAVFQSVLRDKSLLLFLIGVALLNETHQMVTVFFNQLQFVRSGMGSDAIAIVFVLANVLYLISSQSDKITRFLGAKRLIRISYLFTLAACVVLAMTDRAILSILGILAIRGVFALFQPLQIQLQNVQIRSKDRATVLSAFSMTMSSVGIGTNLIFGVAAQKNLPFAFGCGAFFCLVGFLFVNLWIRKAGNRFLV